MFTRRLRRLQISTTSGTRPAAPHIRLTAALSDGNRLYAMRYATDNLGPSLYNRWSTSQGGRAVVSEPLEDGEGDWLPFAPGSLITFEEDRVCVEPFFPVPLAAVA